MTSSGGAGGSGGSADGGAGGAGGGAGGGGGGHALIPDTACAAPAVAGVEVYDMASAPLVHQLASVGGRWMANGEDGYVFFDRDGDNADGTPTLLLPNRSAIVSEGATGGIAASNDTAIQFLRLDEDGEMLTPPVGIALVEPAVLSVASNAGDTLVSWAYNTRIDARGFTSSDSLAGPAFTVTLGAYSTFAFLASASRGPEVGIVWSGDPAVGENKTLFMRADLEGPIGDPSLLYESAAVHSVAQVAATDTGYVVLLTGEPPSYRPLLLLLDPTGQPTDEVVGLAGAELAYGVASTGDGFAVVVGRVSGEAELRAFDLDLTPRGDWVCLGQDHDPTRPPAIATDGDGFAVVHTTAAGAVMLHRTDAMGTGAP